MPRIPDPVRVAAGRYAIAHRRDRNVSPEEREAAHRDFAAARLERAVRETLEDAPPLTVEQRQRIARLLAGGAA